MTSLLAQKLVDANMNVCSGSQKQKLQLMLTGHVYSYIVNQYWDTFGALALHQCKKKLNYGYSSEIMHTWSLTHCIKHTK